MKGGLVHQLIKADTENVDVNWHRVKWSAWIFHGTVVEHSHHPQEVMGSSFAKCWTFFSCCLFSIVYCLNVVPLHTYYSVEGAKCTK